ncbi:FAD binding domain-containing protein [Aspergillus foveolatus]|uniref:FAD binding domain-containing protein n=1 Tax=Aspergillus foveolatus TaxID=210207 RepID=UPI003CCCD8BE
MSAGSLPVIIIGAGPVGMILSYGLSRLQVPTIVIEENPPDKTTEYPKMDLTNSRSMELLRTMRLANACRAIPGSIAEDVSFECVFVTSLHPENGRELGRWSVPCVAEQTSESKRTNDGSFPAEPGQRCSQILVEKWMRRLVLDCENVEFRGSWRYVGHAEEEDRVRVTAVDPHGNEHAFVGRFLVGCDGGKSAVRKAAGIEMIGAKVPARFHLVHFRSRALASILDRNKSRFWHAFPTGSGFLIDQDGKDTFTAHCPLTEDEARVSSAGDRDLPPNLDPKSTIGRVLGGYGVTRQCWELPIDEILVDSIWQPSLGIAAAYSTPSLLVFLAGDAGHLSPPHGGYGMNSGIVDAVSLSWRLAAVMKGYGGSYLLRSYSLERRPMMMRALCRSYRHLMEHVKLGSLYLKFRDVLEAEGDEGENVRMYLRRWIAESGPDILDRGIELDLDYEGSPCIWTEPQSEGEEDDAWDVQRYRPSTRPGRRAPHVFLKDGKTSTYDFLGTEWTLMQFITHESESEASKAETLLRTAKRRGFPLQHVLLCGEEQVRRIWRRDLVLVRPDSHVAWRGNGRLEVAEAETVLDVVLGKSVRPKYTPLANTEEGLFLKTVDELASMGKSIGKRARPREVKARL